MSRKKKPATESATASSIEMLQSMLTKTSSPKVTKDAGSEPGPSPQKKSTRRTKPKKGGYMWYRVGDKAFYTLEEAYEEFEK